MNPFIERLLFDRIVITGLLPGIGHAEGHGPVSERTRDSAL